jgi:putative membrane protein
MTGWFTRFFAYWLINIAVLWTAGALFSSVSFDSTASLLKAGIWLGAINLFLKPLFVLITLPLTIITLGLFLIVINVLVLYMVEWLVPGMRLGEFWHTAIVSIFVSLGTMVLSSLIKVGKND